jgi:hypothetical protein
MVGVDTYGRDGAADGAGAGGWHSSKRCAQPSNSEGDNKVAWMGPFALRSFIE